MGLWETQQSMEDGVGMQHPLGEEISECTISIRKPQSKIPLWRLSCK
jgi:hypothetical protein